MTVLILLEDAHGSALGAIADTMGSSSAPVGCLVSPTWWLPSTGIIPSPSRLKDRQRYPVAMLRKFVDISVPRSKLPLRVLVCGDVEAAYMFKTVVEEVSRNGRKGLVGALRGMYNPELPEAVLHVCLEIFQQRSKRPLAYAVPLASGVDGNPTLLRWYTGMTKQTSADGDVDEVIRDVPYFGRIRLLATGAKDLSEKIAEIATRYACDDENNGNEQMKKLVRAVYSIPSALLDEDASSETKTLINAVGGYYEGYIAVDGGLRNSSPAITLFIHVEDNLTTVSVEALFLHAYIGEELYVVSIPPYRPVRLIGKAIPWNAFSLAKISPLRGHYPPQSPLEPHNADEAMVKEVAAQCIATGAFRLRMSTLERAIRWTTLPGSPPDTWRLIVCDEGLILDQHGKRLTQRISRLAEAATNPDSTHN